MNKTLEKDIYKILKNLIVKIEEPVNIDGCAFYEVEDLKNDLKFENFAKNFFKKHITKKYNHIEEYLLELYGGRMDLENIKYYDEAEKSNDKSTMLGTFLSIVFDEYMSTVCNRLSEKYNSVDNEISEDLANYYVDFSNKKLKEDFLEEFELLFEN